MSAPSTSGLSVKLLLRVIDVKYGCFTLLYFVRGVSGCCKISVAMGTLSGMLGNLELVFSTDQSDGWGYS